MRVLIAEDEALIRMDLREMLEEEGHTVVAEARDGIEALEAARELKPDVVFMDIEMPRMTGIEAAGIIGKEGIAPVVMVTAFSQTGYIDAAVEVGVMAYLVKPFTKPDILPAMHVALSRFDETRMLEREVDDLTERLETRKTLDRAKGVLIGKGLSEPEAFKRLQKLAMDKRLTLKQVAQAILLASEAEEE